MAGLIERERSTARVAIKKVGEEATLHKPQEGAENAYNRQSDADKTYTDEGTAYAVRVTRLTTERLSRKSATGGTVDRQSPVIALGHDSPVEEGWKVEFPDGLEYHLTAQTPVRSHDEFRAELV
jgi:hypothetical protein